MHTRQCVACGKLIKKDFFSVLEEETYCSLACVSPPVATKEAVFRAIIDYKQANDGNSPSPKMLAEILGYSSKNALIRRLKQLEKEGLIRRVPRSSHIHVVGGLWIPPEK